VIQYREGEREMVFSYKDDEADGGLKIIQSRYNVRPGASKYLLPDRYQAGKKEVSNRFFSPVVHYDVNQWRAITGVAPQMIALVPENISNTSNRESESTLRPKSAYYKGFDYSSGWIFDGEEMNYFPFMFAVNYKPGGEQDPILSYSDERIGNEDSGYTIGTGLLKRFFWHRLAIMRNGQLYKSFFRLTSGDVLSLHREFKGIHGNKYERPFIKSYKPLLSESTEVELWKWEPVLAEDLANTFPSAIMIMEGNNSTDSDDMKYSPLKVLASDIPQ
jgi:hypothetical protein